MRRTMAIIATAVAVAVLLTIGTGACGSSRTESRTTLSPQESAIVGKWFSPSLSYYWYFLRDRTFKNEKGSKGVWSFKSGLLVAKATNHGNNPSTWRLQLNSSGKTLKGTWSDPEGNNGTTTLYKK